jgi:hypothetical protein
MFESKVFKVDNVSTACGFEQLGSSWQHRYHTSTILLEDGSDELLNLSIHNSRE